MKLKSVKHEIWVKPEKETWDETNVAIFPIELINAINIFHDSTPYSELKFNIHFSL